MSILVVLLVPLPSLANSVSTDPTLGKGLLDYYRLDETSGVRFAATSTQDLTDNNTVASGLGIIFNGADFELSNSEWLSITDASQTNLDLNSSFTMCYWYKPESLSDYHIHISKFGSTNNSRAYRIGHSASTALIQIGTSGGSGVNTATWSHSLSTGVWGYHCYAYSMANGTSTYYYNAASQGTKTGLGTSIANTSSDFELCRSNNPAEYYCDGILDEVFILNRVANQSEISTLYNSGIGLSYEPLAQAGPTIPVIFDTNGMNQLLSTSCTSATPTTTCSYSYIATSTEPMTAISLSLILLMSFIVTLGSASFLVWIYQQYNR